MSQLLHLIVDSKFENPKNIPTIFMKSSYDFHMSLIYGSFFVSYLWKLLCLVHRIFLLHSKTRKPWTLVLASLSRNWYVVFVPFYVGIFSPNSFDLFFILHFFIFFGYGSLRTDMELYYSLKPMEYSRNQIIFCSINC